MTDIETRAKRIVYSLARAVEAWRGKHGGRSPVILMPPHAIAVVALGAAGVIDVEFCSAEQDERGVMLGLFCHAERYIDVVGGERVYLAEEVEINAKQNGSA